MNTPCNLPYFELEVNKDGGLVTPSQADDAVNFLKSHGQVKDLLLMSHGWNNDMSEARALYEGFFTQVCSVLGTNAASGVSAAQCAVVGILWPSKKFADESLIPGGAAGLADPDDTLLAALDQLQVAVGPEAAPKINTAKALLPSLESDPDAQQKFVALIRSLIPNRTDDEEGVQHLFEQDGDEILDLLRQPVRPTVPVADDDMGGAAAIGAVDPEVDPEGGAQSLGAIWDGIKGAVMRFLNVTTYYVMKDRAGIVGRGAVADTLGRIQHETPALRIHLMGHSFGARVVTSAVATVRNPVASMSLLQAAFSHNSFSPDFDGTHQPGGFRNVIENRKIAGPIAITHTVKDLAVGIAYAVASRLARQNASAIGDANDPYGGLGRNGAQHTPEAADGTLQAVGSPYSFGRILNLNADAIIMSHGDITHPQVAYAMLSAAGLAR